MVDKRTRILIISQYFPPDISGGSTRAYNYAKCLVEQNYDVTVITAPPHQHAAVPKEYHGKLTCKEKMSGINLIRVWIPSLLHSSVRNSTILVCSFLLSSLFPIFSVKADIILAFEPNLFSIIPAYIYSKLRGGKVIRIVDDLWPELLYERKIVRSKFLKKILGNLARFSYTYPEYILPLNDEVKEIIHKSYGVDASKIEVITHGVNTDIFTFNERKRGQNFILLYSGSLVESYDFDIIVGAAKRLKNKSIKFIIRGKGKLLSHIQEQKEKFQLDNLIINTDFVPIDQLSKVLGESDVLLVPLGKGDYLNSSLPTKMLEYQAIGRPIICCSSGPVGNYVEKTKCGIRTEGGDLDAFIDVILKLESDPNLCEVLGRNGRTYVEENLTFENIGKNLSRIIHNTLKKSK
jgi:hypothetical protein